LNKTVEKGISDIVGCLTDPIIVFPGGWGDTLPDWLKTAITLERMTGNMKALKGEEPIGTDAEVCAGIIFGLPVIYSTYTILSILSIPSDDGNGLFAHKVFTHLKCCTRGDQGQGQIRGGNSSKGNDHSPNIGVRLAECKPDDANVSARVVRLLTKTNDYGTEPTLK
jgi:hypothetical protein